MNEHRCNLTKHDWLYIRLLDFLEDVEKEYFYTQFNSFESK